MAEKKNHLLEPLLISSNDLAKEYKRRLNTYETLSVHPKNQQTYLEQGWEFDTALKQRVRLKKLKVFDEILENKFWCLLYRMGYSEMNQGRHFKIKYKRNGAEDGEKQIDVFAKDEETVVVAECKASKEIKKRSLQNDLEAFANLKKSISNSLKSHYGSAFKPKILWLFVTENIIWSQPDVERAKGENIKIITEREFRYFKEITDHLGPAAKYQFLAEFFHGQSIPELNNKKVPAIRGKLGGKTFYSFVATPKQLLKISFVNHRALDDPQGIPTYQRLVQKGRLKKIGEFLANGGFFPTNLLINFSSKVRFEITHKDEETDVHFGHLYLPDKYKSAWVVDGQHRLYGYSGLDEKFLKQNLLVLAFENMPRVEEANLFVTINHEQKSVPRNLLDDLEGELKWGSAKPSEKIGAIAARLIKNLNSDLGSPFYNRVTAQGIRATEQTCLTVPAIKDGIKKSGLIGRAAIKMKVYEHGALAGSSDQETLQRAKECLNQFFTLIKDSNIERWNLGREGYICFNPAIQGYLLLFSALIDYWESKTKLDAKELIPDQIVESVKPYLTPVLEFVSTASAQEFEALFKVSYGSSGPVQYFYRLCKLVKQSIKDFSPEGFQEWEASQSGEQILLADKRIKELTALIQSTIFSTFKKAYGEKDNAYWERGVTNNEMKTNAYKKSLDDEVDKRLPLEAYLDFIELKKIVENKTHWALFKPIFDIPMPGDKGQAKNLDWMERFNKLRRIPAHASKERNYATADFQFLEWIESELKSRIEKEDAFSKNAEQDILV